MKRIYAILPLLLIFKLLIIQPASAQDCDNATDCLTKAKNNNFSESSLKIYDQAIKFAKKEKLNLSKFYFERGVRYYNFGTGHTKEAEKDFDAAISADPTYYWPYSWKASIYQVRLKDYDKAKKWLNKMVETFPEDARAYYDRAHNHRYYNHLELALPDFENAYNLLILMMDDSDQIPVGTKGNICRWYAIAYMKKNEYYVHDIRSLEILETGAGLAPNSPALLGDLAMAYYDNDKGVNAEEVGIKARLLDSETTYERINTGGEFLGGMSSYKQKDLFAAASAMNVAHNNMKHPHPAILYWSAIASWEYDVSMYDTNPNLWKNQKGMIKERLEKVLKYGQGTKYQYLVDAAKKNLEQIK